MQKPFIPMIKKEGTFFYLCLLTGFFLLIEVSFFIQCNNAYLADYLFMTDHIHLPPTIFPAVIYFIIAQLLVHLAYLMTVWIVASAMGKFLDLAPTQELILSVSLWLMGMITVFAANQHYLPNSKFAELSGVLLNDSAAQLIFKVGGLCLTMSFCISLLGSRVMRLFSAVLIALVGGLYVQEKMMVSTSVATQQKPNIIIVGVDSLRPDFLSYFGHQRPTPFFDSLLERSTIFSEAVTPLARTFPSWTGILTGKYPRQIGIRSNLADSQRIRFVDALPAILRHHGYKTLYATDETRFSNIDVNYGFDHVITPPMGVNDFLLGTFNDFPLSNLLINTPVGKWLFPYSYANRPVYFSYDPNSFLHLVNPYLQGEKKQPLFLAIHFCLPHHPYLWRGLVGQGLDPLARYTKSITRTDQALHDFFGLLREAHLLDHALVVLLSDHGEALELSGDRITEEAFFLSNSNAAFPHFYPTSLENESVNQSVGHGTDVLSLTQYHTLLAFKLYGMGEQRENTIPGVVSLLAIQPTILELIKVQQPLKNSLAGIIINKAQKVLPHQHIFLESDFSPESIRTVYPEVRKVVLEGIQLFQINPRTTRLTVRENMVRMIIKSKQYADIYDDWMLASYPQNDHYRMPILINLVSGRWTNDLESDFAKQSPVKKMLGALKGFYGNEID
jgi:hypothetical protein